MLDDDLIKYISDEIEKSEDGISVMDPGRVQDIGVVYNVMKSVVKGTGIRVTYELNAPYSSMGSVSVTGKGINVSEPSLFVKAVKLASNMEIYPKVDGTVVIDLTFHRLTRRVGDNDGEY